MSATAADRDPWVSERLTYRALEEEDQAFILDKLLVDAGTRLNLLPSLPVPPGKKQGKKLWEHFNNNTLMTAIVCKPLPGAATSSFDEKQRPTPIGVVCLLSSAERENAHHHRATLGIIIAPDYQSQGYGSEAINWALDFGFIYANLHRIGLNVWSYNERAMRLYESLGFVHEGRQRDFGWMGGRYQDQITISMLEDEWRQRRETNSGIVHR
ncbi:acyl-CoA N-acyltransferase [Neohortaea acidophila]|uniref:Acyl-CoA N-acyltransferase n=1 Tax=Neohortaea acidophila TaxID=245834 RepID=A0A6A6Q390_9PEZI|nr:acyl-CoA N-acyltransferase [Neohortaea acidophila]KAF2486474.1 acyl-CoA N-acyltransferase [Neohortaea acidophila]